MNFLPLQFFPEKIAPRGQTFRSLPVASHPLRRRDDESGKVGTALCGWSSEGCRGGKRGGETLYVTAYNNAG